MSGSQGDAGSVRARVSIAGRVIDEAEALEETERRLNELQRPMTEAEQQELESARIKSADLEQEHGPNYPGFGHPPPQR